MKPSERITEISTKSILENKGLQQLQSMPDSESKVHMVAIIGYAIQIQAIMDYLDEEYEKNRPCWQCKKLQCNEHLA